MDKQNQSSVPSDTKEHVENSQVDYIEHVSTGNSNEDNADDEEDFKLTWGKFLAILSFQLGYFSDTLVISMCSAALAPINKDLGPSKAYVWIATSELVASAAISPIVGRLGDIFGRRNFLIAGDFLGIVGTAVSATAKDINTLIVGGVLIGIASSMRQLAWSCLGELVPRKSRGLAFALLQISLSPASAFAPLIAFGFISNGSWRPIYWLCFALDILALVLVFLFYHPVNQYIHEEGKTTWYQIRHTDWLGCILFIGGLGVLLVGISFGGNQYPWSSAGTIVPIIVGAITLVVLGIYEAKATIKYPIFPAAMFKNIRGFTIIQIGVLLVGMLFYSTAVLWPLQVQTLYATDSIKIGLYSAASGLGGFAFGGLFGVASRIFPHLRWQFVFVMLTLTILCGAQASVTATSNVGSTCIVILVFAFVAGASVDSTAMIQVGVPHEYIGVASGILVCSRSVGGAIGATIYTTILQNKVKAEIPIKIGIPLAKAGLPPTTIAAVIEALASGNVASPALASLAPQLLFDAIEGLKQSYVSGFRLVYLVSIAFGLAATITVCFAADVDHLMTSKVDIKLDEGAHIKTHTNHDDGHVVNTDKA